VDQREVEENEGEEGSELVWKNRARRVSFYSGGVRQGTTAKSTMATWLQGASELVEGATLFNTSWR
jgi:hypothetical protein